MEIVNNPWRDERQTIFRQCLKLGSSSTNLKVAYVDKVLIRAELFINTAKSGRPSFSPFPNFARNRLSSVVQLRRERRFSNQSLQFEAFETPSTWRALLRRGSVMG
jgi:hypothetical protein